MEQDNTPELWSSYLPVPCANGHKYDRGYGIVFGGDKMTGAACLSAEAMMRIGAGLCTILCLTTSAPIYRTYAPYLMVDDIESWDELEAHIQDPRRNVILIGPGLVDIEPAKLRDIVYTILSYQKLTVIDASALTAFAGHARDLQKHCHDKVVLTPHMGEFHSLFPDFEGTAFEKAKKASEFMKATIILKGHETIIANFDQIIVNRHASPYLSSAGTGDVLAGMVSGLLAQGMPIFHAACAGVWMHGEAGIHTGPGLVASDISKKIPEILKKFV